MARLPRLAVAEQPHLVIQCSRDARPAFFDDTDRRLYLQSLIDMARDCSVAVHAYSLVDSEVSLVATPADAHALGQLMQRVGRRYVAAFNRRHALRGALWAGRFQAAAFEPERYLLQAMRYVEQAAVRAGAAAQPQEWPWSSAAHHVGTISSTWITEHPAHWRLGNTPFEREAKYRSELLQMLSDEQVRELVNAARRGWPLGSSEFISTLPSQDRPLRPQPKGRPRRVLP